MKTSTVRGAIAALEGNADQRLVQVRPGADRLAEEARGPLGGEGDGRREQGTSGGGGRTEYAFFLEEDRALGYAREAVHQALVSLEAVAAPAGTMPVVLGPGWPGILLHEAIGHGLEGDFNRKGTSAFAGRVGPSFSVTPFRKASNAGGSGAPST